MVHSVTSGSSGSSSESAEHILFDTAKLATRPPTPPRESSRPPDSPLKDPSDAHRDAVHSTPNSSNTSTDRPKKRVEFSPWTDYHRPDDPSPQRAAKPDLTPKSILKPFNPSVISITANNIPFYSHDSFPAMLESITQALASTERSKKLDTYVTFTNCLKAYDDQPDVRALKNKMPLLCSFIRRDLFAKAPNSVNNSNDSQLIQQAVKLLAILAWLPTLAESIPEDDAVFFIQHATQLIQNPQSPKILVSPFLHFLSTQVFPPRFMTAERVGSIITALQNLEDRIGGNTVIQARLQIYKKLMHQNKQVMASRTIDWMEHLLAATLSNHKETRTVAMVCMSEAAKLLGSEKSVTRGVGNLLNRESGDGVRLFEKVRERLEEFLKNGDGSHVAQIWGVMILLLRGRPPITNWEYFNPWLQVIQDCFNSPNVTTKVAANTAWRRIIYVLNCGTELNTKNMELLTRPISRYLSPQSSSSSPKGPRQAALSNICALLYYNFRPNAPAKHISLTWDLVVVALIEKLVLHSQNEVDDGCKILTALFDGTHQKAWNEVRGLEASAIKPEEIFRLDPKWVKFNSAIVLKTIEVALRRSTWEGEDPVICVLWRKFTKTLADANMKEIKISAETMETVAHIFNLFQRLWHDGPSLYVNAENKSSAQFMHRFAFLITTTFDAIGTICFTEKQLSFDEHNEFVAASTPSNRFSSSNSFSAAFHSPVVHLFQLFLQPFQGAEVSKEYFESIRTIISKCLEAQDSRRKGLSLLAACSSVLPQRGASTVDLEAWNIVADLAGKALSKPQEKAHISPTPVTWEFKDVVKILQWGCRYNVPAWASLFHIFVTTVQEEQGDAQMISTVIEPLAEILRLEKLDSDSPVWLIHGKTLLEKAQYPKLKASEIVARIPFGGSNRKATNTESYDNLYDMVDQFLSTAYTVCEDQKSIQTVANFIVAVTEFVYRAPPTSLLLLLRRIQNGMAVWLADSKNLLIKKESGLTMTVQGLWNAVTNAITRLPRHDSLALQSMTVLVASGLESSRKAIVNSSIKTWNSSFGKQASLEYPSRVRLAMKKLRPIADIALPAFPEDIDEIVPTPPIWTESQESEDFVPDQNLWSSPTPIPSARRRDRTSSPTKEPVPLSNRSFLARLRDASSKPSPKARPKHLDSQVIFAPIERGSGNTSEEVDSQVLTEHQKEVRDRQHEEPSVYLPGLSTERPKKVVRPFVKSASIPPIVLNKQLSERQQRSPSVDEFVDAPEVVTKDIPESAKSQDTPSYLQEVDVVPSTVFTVQVPSRTRSDSTDSGGSDGHEESEKVLKRITVEKPTVDQDVELSRYFTATQRPSRVLAFQKSLPPSRNTSRRLLRQSSSKETSPGSEYQTVPATFNRDGAVGIFTPSNDNGKENDDEEGQASVASTAGQESESAKQLQRSISEVPDSYSPDVERPDTEMVDCEEAVVVADEASMKTVNSIPPTQYPEDEQLRAENEETSNAINESNDNSQLSTTTPPPQDKPDTDSEEEAPSPVARSSRKPKAAARRSSTRARTKPLKVRIMEQEEAMLDFITVSKSPAKSPAKSVSASSSFAEAPEAIVTPMATPRRKRGAASRLEAEAARESPAAKSPSVRKRKQAASETPVPATETTNADEPTDEPEIQHRAGRPRKRRATSTALSTPLKPQSSEPPTTPAQREPTPPAPPPPEPVVPGASSPPRSTRKTLPPPRSRRTPARTPARSSVRAETTSSAVKNTPTRSTRIRRSAIPVEPEPAAAVESVQVQVRVDESIIMDSQPELPPLPEPPLDLLPLPEPEPAKPHHQESDVLETHSDPVPEAEPEPEPEVEEVVDVAEEVAVVEEVKKDPMKELKRALEVLQQSLDMDSLDLREAEDAVFETYVKLRDKRRKRELA